MDAKKKKTLEDYMVAVPDEELKAEKPSDTIALDEPIRRLWLAILLYTVIVAVIVASGYAVFQKYQNKEILSIEDKLEDGLVVDDSSKPVLKYVYVEAEDGLNLRESDSTESAALVLIPDKTKLEIIEEKDDWIKVEYDGKIGWCKRELTLQP